MEFKGQYLTYQEYKGLGGTLSLTPFNLLEFEARREIDLRTQSRLVNEKEIPEEVKMCVYNLINTLNLYKSEESKAKQSESVGSYSVSYGSGADITKNKNVEVKDIIKRDLHDIKVNGENLIYMGVD